MSARYQNVARVMRTHGTKGEVVVAPLRGLPFCLFEGMTIALTPPSFDVPRWFVLDRIRGQQDSEAIVLLQGVDSIQGASVLVNKTILVARSDIHISDTQFAFEQLIGRSVQDRSGTEIGQITEILESPAHPIWVIFQEGGQELLLPQVDAFVPHIPVAGPISVHVPAGLMADDGSC
ncbi:ribosome maturation factor RimM [Collinsella sp. zg1085]|uniref:ribosome maturation factor RimM n=1 Tax=Collinsella sp. zg1085 TaxID=2844380 RepID=UPI001C0C6A7E|nr:ribosome maturation factor RimM [Collinsella sp. zg1085]QWT17050.1 ribosome maturation factor RimM [Collinsella sp. zg1085]